MQDRKVEGAARDPYGCRAIYRPCSFRKKSPGGEALPLLIFLQLHSGSAGRIWPPGMLALRKGSNSYKGL